MSATEPVIEAVRAAATTAYWIWIEARAMATMPGYFDAMRATDAAFRNANYRVAVFLAWRANTADLERWGGLFCALTATLRAAEPDTNVKALIGLHLLGGTKL